MVSNENEVRSFQAVLLEAERRDVRVSNLDVIDITPSSDERPLVGFPGAMTAFLGRKGTGAIERLREAIVDGGDRENVKRALYGLTGGVGTKRLAQKIIRQPVFADIRYGGEVLNHGVFVPEESNLAMAMFPFNGGRVSQDGFDLVEYYLNGSDVSLEGLVVQVSPPMTAAESAALAKVPTHHNSRNVGVAAWCDSTWWSVAGFVVSATYAVTCTIVAATKEPRALSKEQLERLDPTASARELLAIRREHLLQSFE